MKALINLRDVADTNLARMFPASHTYMLPVANKPLLDYYIELCASCGVTRILILDPDYDAEIAAWVSNGSRWSLSVQYFGARSCVNLNEIRRHHKDFFADADELLWLNGLSFYHCDFATLSMERLIRNSQVAALKPEMPDGMYFVRGDECLIPELELTCLHTLRSFFQCNCRVLREEEEFYDLPGYRIENGVHTGMNVVIPPNCVIEAPVVIGDNVSLGEHTHIEGGVVIGNDVIIDKRTTLKETIILDHSYIGRDLELYRKIIDRDRVLDPASGEEITLLDNMLLTDVRAYEPLKLWWHSMDILGAAVLLVWLTPWFVLFSLLGKRVSGQRHYRSLKLRTRSYPVYSCIGWKWKDVYFLKFSLDKYRLLFQVFSGDLALVGDCLRSTQTGGERQPNPGVFSFSESKSNQEDALQREWDNRYYRHNRSMGLGLNCIIKTLFRRLFWL